MPGTSLVRPTKRTRSPSDALGLGPHPLGVAVGGEPRAPHHHQVGARRRAGEQAHGAHQHVDALFGVDATHDPDQRCVPVGGEMGAHLGRRRAGAEAVEVDRQGRHDADPCPGAPGPTQSATAWLIAAVTVGEAHGRRQKAHGPRPGRTRSWRSSDHGAPRQASGQGAVEMGPQAVGVHEVEGAGRAGDRRAPTWAVAASSDARAAPPRAGPRLGAADAGAFGDVEGHEGQTEASPVLLEVAAGRDGQGEVDAARAPAGGPAPCVASSAPHTWRE